MLDLAVGIVSWNTRDMTLACLASLTAELDRLSVTSRVWVIDNASGDGSAEAIAREYPEVALVRNVDNVGFAAANNQFLAAGEARYYLLLNPDTVVHEGAIATLLAEMARQPHAGAAGPKLLLADGSIQRSFWRLPTLGGELRFNLVHRFFPFGPLFKRIFSRRLPAMAAIRETMPVDALSMACLLVDRRVLDAVGRLSEDYFLFSEENDFFLRAAAAGWQGYYVPAAHVTHLVGQSRSRLHHRVSHLNFFRSRTIFFAKYHRASLRRYRLISRFFLTWSECLTWIQLALGRAAREDVLVYREMKVVLDDIAGPAARAGKAGGPSTW